MAKTKEVLIKEVIEKFPEMGEEELLGLTNAELEELLKEEEVEPFVLLQSDIKHEVSKVIDKTKGLSVFKFGRKSGIAPIPTRVPKEYGENLLRTYPNKYTEVPVPDKAKNLKEFFVKLVEDQDNADIRDKEKEEKALKDAEEKKLKEMQKLGKAKKIIRE